MSEKKSSSVLNFFKRNLYYLLIGVSLIIIATVIAIVLAFGNADLNEGSKPNESVTQPQESTPESESESEYRPGESLPDKPQESTPDDKPVDGKIIFVLPVANSTVSKDYTSSTVVFNQTLGVYTGHMGIDFSAQAGEEVVAVYGGTIESITTSYLKGTTVTIDHGNGLKSVYNSIDAIESLAEGQTVTSGQVIGSVSDNNRQEYKDGPHLHFEVTLNGEWVDPDDYLMMAEK